MATTSGDAARALRVACRPSYDAGGPAQLATLLSELSRGGALAIFPLIDRNADPADAKQSVAASLAAAALTVAGWIELPLTEAPAALFDAVALRRETLDQASRLLRSFKLPLVADRYEVEAVRVRLGFDAAQVERAFCPLPWTHFFAESDGVAMPCCVAALRSDGTSLRTHTLAQAFNSQGMRRVRLNMLAGVRDAACRDCYDAEDRGQRSFRQDGEFTNALMRDRPQPPAERIANARAITQADGSLAEHDIRLCTIDIRWSNICNLKCRMCGHGSSSSWFDDARQVADRIDAEDQARGTYHAFRSVRSAAVRGDKAIISFNSGGQAYERVRPYLTSVSHVYFAGGEPLLMDEHYWLLEQLAPRAAEVSLSYNTNLTRLRYRDHDLLSIWDRFRSVTLNVSVDGLGPVGEYVRTGFDTATFLANLGQLRAAQARGSKLTYQLDITLSLHNLFHIPDMMESALRDGHVSSPDAFTMKVVRQPLHASPSALPQALREQAAAKLEALMHSFDRAYPQATATRSRIEDAIIYLRATPSVTFEQSRDEAWRWLIALDELRGTSFRDVAPHLACLAP
jgi:hypothetical protein